MYHDILPEKEVFFDVTPGELEAHFQFLQEIGATPISIDWLISHLRTGIPLPAKPVLLTFDDGYGGHYQYVYPLLRKYNYPAVFSIYINKMAQKTGRTSVTWQQLREMAADPLVQIVSHSVSHPRDLRLLSDADLEQEVFKIPEFFGEKTKDTVTAQEFILRIDECQISNDWNDTTTFANFRLCLRGEAEEWLSSTVRHLKLTAAQKTWTRIRPLFKREFATTTDDKLIVDGLANLSHRQGENPRKFFSRLEKLCNVLHENFASYRIKPNRPAQLPDGHYSEDALTQYANDSVEAYNQFLFTQIFKAAAPENVRKLLSHKDQTFHVQYTNVPDIVPIQRYNTQQQ